MQVTNILVVEDDAGLREALADTLALANYHVLTADSAESALLLLKQKTVKLIISDVQMAGVSGLQLLRTLRDQYPELPVLMMTAYATVKDAVEAIRLGAVDYLAKPFSPEVLVNTVSRYVAAEQHDASEPVVGASSSQELLKLAAKVARSDASVMILGPSGSGKEVLARYIHQQSERAGQPFIAINCAAIPENMLESTLFGYEKGAFTGAINACPGKFEQAQNGTILLDEITEMDLNLQAKLLRVLQEREVERLGGRKTIKLNVRVLATSNRNLKEAVQQGVFREDLFYRLNVFPLKWPALCERPDDILPLARYLSERYSRQQGQAVPVITEQAAVMLRSYSWPGNVRELDNVIQRALILQSNGEITTNDLMLEFTADSEFVPDAGIDIDDGFTSVESDDSEIAANSFKAEIYEQEHRIILATMKACANRRKDVAEKLGISDRTLRYKLARMRENGIDIPA